jgi:5'(3')-deoxyribonucleotidase
MIIACDIDGVLNNLTEKALELYNSRTGKNLQQSDITKYRFLECLPKEDAEGICKLFKEKTLWDSLTPLPYSQKCLRSLSNQGHQIIIATATDPINFEWKCQWMQYHFPFIPTDNIIRIMDKGLLKCDVLIDDNIDNLISNFCERVVIDAPWNKESSKDMVYDIYRAYDWRDVSNIIHNIERKNEEWLKK